MRRNKRWNIIPADPAAEQLAQSLKSSPLFAQGLLNRGLRDVEACRAFLNPTLNMLHSPELLPGVPAAAERLAQAVRDKQRIVIYGDYDVDGITAISILWHAIRILGGSADYYIPHRDEGYGIHAEAITALCDHGAQLIVSVDCGVTAIEAAAVARQHGVDLIITDHHEFCTDTAGKAQFPDCLAIVHPRLPVAGMPPHANGALCGAGVAFKLAWAVGQLLNGSAKVSDDFRDYLVDATALAGFGTIADIVPLVGENRVLAKVGLVALEKSRLPGLKALIASAGLSNSKLDGSHVAFRLAPRLNACGRMEHASLAAEMLTSADDERASEIAVYLDQQNRDRQAVGRKILAAAVSQVEENGFDSDDCCALVLGAEDWHPGVIGIVASRLVELYHRPTIMVALPLGRGSGRSIPGFHLSRALNACRHLLVSGGGHEMAAGLTIDPARFQEFREAFDAYAKSVITPEMLIPQLKIESPVELRQITAALIEELARLGPFGHGNGEPLLIVRNVRLAGPPFRVGKTGDHLKFTVRQGGSTMKCIAWGFGEMCDRLTSGTVVSLAVEPTINEYRGRVTTQLEIKDLLIADNA